MHVVTLTGTYLHAPTLNATGCLSKRALIMATSILCVFSFCSVYILHAVCLHKGFKKKQTNIVTLHAKQA